MTTTLTEFLLARIAEDESAARAAWPADWEADRNRVQSVGTGLRAGYEGMHTHVANLAMSVGNYQAEERNAAHIARWDPARVLIECETKRRILKVYKEHWLMCRLALPYADHPDYRDEWRP